MFKRLNTGGELLSDQQLRNCTIRLLDSVFPDFIIEMSRIQEFEKCTSGMTSARQLSAFDQELVLRFFALKNRIEWFRHDVSEFLTEYMEAVADPSVHERFNFDIEEKVFRKTFTVLSKALGGYAFSIANKRRNDLAAGFGAYHYEAITIGLQSVLEKIQIENPDDINKIKETLKKIKLNHEFIVLTTGGGKNSPGPLKKRISFVKEKLEDAFIG